MNDIEYKIETVINNLRPYLINDGGDIEFVKYENNIVYVKMQGACANCHMQDLTLKDGIESILKDEIDKKIEVINLL